jgi:hypothetical protein
MDTEDYPDPFRDAMSHALQRAVQVTSSAVTGAQAYAYLNRTHTRANAERDKRARRALEAEQRAERDAARAEWALALDPRWIRQADLLQTARVWGAAMPYADPTTPWHEPAAATAMRACEERLRELHPTAMARYDRLRGEGMAPAEAMREAAFLFAGPPRAHDSPYEPAPMLNPGDGKSSAWTVAAREPGREDSQAAEMQERRGRQIVEELQARAREQGRDPLGEAEQRIVLETVTNLPAEVIDRVVRPDQASDLGRAEYDEAAGRTDPQRAAAGLMHAERDRAATADRVRASDLDAATDLSATPRTDERAQNLVGARDAAATADGATARAARPWEQDFPVPIGEVVANAARATRAAAASSTAAPAPGRSQTRRPGQSGPRP